MNNRKTVYAIEPCHQEKGSNFKMFPYQAWVKVGGRVASPHYLTPKLRGIAYHMDFPSLRINSKDVRLRFSEACTLRFDCFPDYIHHEIIPMVWDCWPMFFEKTCRWFQRHHVRTAIFTSSQTAERIQQRFPKMNIMTITEGIATDLFEEGQRLTDRCVALYEIGSVRRGYFRKKYPDDYKRLFTKPVEWGLRTHDDYKRLLQNSQLTVIFPRSITQPEMAQGLETLTQRYWECMLSRILMVGHAPKELTDLVGYNPVIEMDMEHDLEQIEAILSDIANPVYQELVDRNRETALKMGSWDIRMKQVMEWLRGLGYEV